MANESDIEFDDTTIGASFGDNKRRHLFGVKSAASRHEEAEREDSRLIRDMKLISNDNKLSPGVYRSPLLGASISSPYGRKNRNQKSQDEFRVVGSPVVRPAHQRPLEPTGDIEMDPSSEEDVLEPPQALAFRWQRKPDISIDENISKESMIQSIDKTLDEVFGSVQNTVDLARNGHSVRELDDEFLASKKAAPLPVVPDVLATETSKTSPPGIFNSENANTMDTVAGLNDDDLVEKTQDRLANLSNNNYSNNIGSSVKNGSIGLSNSPNPLESRTSGQEAEIVVLESSSMFAGVRRDDFASFVSGSQVTDHSADRLLDADDAIRADINVGENDDEESESEEDADFALETLEKLKSITGKHSPQVKASKDLDSANRNKPKTSYRLDPHILDISKETEASVRKNASTSSPLRNIIATRGTSSKKNLDSPVKIGQFTAISKTNIPSLEATKTQVKDWEEERWLRLERLIKSGLSDTELAKLSHTLFKTTSKDLETRVQFMRYFLKHEDVIRGTKRKSDSLESNDRLKRRRLHG